MNRKFSVLTAGLSPLFVLGAVTACGGSSGTGSESREQSYEISETVTALSLVEGAGKISISSGDGPVRVTETLRYDSREPVTSHRVTGQTLQLEDSGCGNRRCSVDYDIRIPASVAVTVKTSAGGISVTGLAGKLDLTASAGTINGSGLTSQDARLRTSAGTVDLAYSSAPRMVDASATTGKVVIRVPAGTSYAVDAKSEVGSRKVSVPQDPASPHKIRVRTSVGAVSVQNS
ncbi:DUF4097 family beta strand repeat-containing protein [Streptomyces sp. NPDC008121]|uniref:DUF4097 family beta strand repeat-containing protein n=1 Tax=Streptomyces sp. NPDC008121 TaxID=3364809 RepID=UPI0036E804E4